MKLFYVIPLTLLGLMALARPVHAQTVEDNVQQLFETRACYQCNLVKADLRGAHLIGADLRGADLTGANLTAANLEGADLTGANLTDTNLTQAFLTNASLNDTHMIGTNLTEATILFAEAHGAQTENLILTDADLYHTPIYVGGPLEDQ